jgi:hypothetical protein
VADHPLYLNVSLVREAAVIMRSFAALPPQGLTDAVRGGHFLAGRCQFRCSREEAVALQDWLLVRAETRRQTDNAGADVLTQAAADVGEAIAVEGVETRDLAIEDERRDRERHDRRGDG